MLMDEECLLGLLRASQIPDANVAVAAGSDHLVLVRWVKVDGKYLRTVDPMRRRRKGADAKDGMGSRSWTI